jgi:hypothetical protein
MYDVRVELGFSKELDHYNRTSNLAARSVCLTPPHAFKAMPKGYVVRINGKCHVCLTGCVGDKAHLSSLNQNLYAEV